MIQSNVRDEDEPNFTLGVAAGLGAAILGGILWAVISAVTGLKISYMAVAIGFMVGYAVRNYGKGDDVSFGVAGALLALFGCMLGNVLMMDYFVAHQEHLSFVSLLFQPVAEIGLLVDNFRPMDLLFYGIAIYAGFKFSIYE